MAITTKLELRQTHNLKMTPQLQQAIKLLQLSNVELATFVEAELERNPLLERAEPEETAAVAGEPSGDLPAGPFKEDAEGQETASPANGAAPEGEPESSDGDDVEWINLSAPESARSEDLAAE